MEAAIILALVFAAVMLLTVAVFGFVTRRPMAERLEQAVTGPESVSEPTDSSWRSRVAQVIAPAGKLSLPSEGWESSPLRQQFIHAGLRQETAPAVFFAAKTILAAGPPLLYIVVTSLSGMNLSLNTSLFWMLGLAAFGYYLPNLVLSRMRAARQRELIGTFPDAVDLMTIMMDAGLGLDAAITRIGQEIEAQSTALAEEFQLLSLELRAGASREYALRNLALRTGLEDINVFVAMMLQADRFGTSISESLRVYSDSLRVKRRMKAEEAAAKVAVKLLFPLTFCIFPPILMVVVGPAVINILRTFSTIAR